MYEPLKVVGEYVFSHEADLAAGRLKSEGISASVETKGVLGTSWLNPTHLGGVALLVPEDQAERAIALLKEIDSEFEPEYPMELQDQAINLECPDCDSMRKTYRRPNPFVRAFSLRSAFPDGHKARWICRDCGHIWTVEPA